MHRKKSRPGSNLGVIAPAVVRNPQKLWRFAESRRTTQNENKATRAGEQRIGRSVRIAPACGYDVGKISAGCLVVVVGIKRSSENLSVADGLLTLSPPIPLKI